MDVAGAKELARVLAERRRGEAPTAPEPPAKATPAGTNVPPLFRWLGIEPPPENLPAELPE
jgi:hypothetical protein